MHPDGQDMFVRSDDPYADLGGVFEIAQHLGVDIHRVKRWIERRESTRCPQPVAVLHMGHVYSLAEWKGWFALWRLTRDPATTWTRRG